MRNIVDYKCTYEDSSGISKEVTEKLGLEFPDAYKHWDTMASLSLGIKKNEGNAFCELPFCHTVEAEALGGKINYGNAEYGPRAKEYICQTGEEFLALDSMDFSLGRIQEVLKACAYLHGQGERVMLDITGPFTVLDILMDARHVFKILRKQPEMMREIYMKIETELLRYIEEAVDCGVDIIGYADSSGGVNILGPKVMREVTENFTYPFLKKAEMKLKGRCIIHLCPKTTLALVGTGRGKLVNLPLDSKMSYGEACISVIGKTNFTGQMCIKNIGYTLNNQKVKSLILE